MYNDVGQWRTKKAPGHGGMAGRVEAPLGQSGWQGIQPDGRQEGSPIASLG